MRNKLLGILLTQIAAFALVAGASAGELKPGYLHGVWTVDNKENCGNSDIEHLSFAPDGTFKSERFKITDAVGYWREKDDVIQLHLVTSPAHFDKRLQQFQGHFEYFLVQVVPIDVAEDKLRVFGLIGEQITKATMVRCGK